MDHASSDRRPGSRRPGASPGPLSRADAGARPRRGIGLSRRHRSARPQGDRLMVGHSIWSELPVGVAGFLIYVATIAVVLRQGWARSPARIAMAAALLVYAGVIASAILRRDSANFWTLSIFFWFPTVVFLMG